MSLLRQSGGVEGAKGQGLDPGFWSQVPVLMCVLLTSHLISPSHCFLSKTWRVAVSHTIVTGVK